MNYSNFREGSTLYRIISTLIVYLAVFFTTRVLFFVWLKNKQGHANW